MARPLATALVPVLAVVAALLVPVPVAPAGAEPPPPQGRVEVAPRTARTDGVVQVAAGGEYSCGITGDPAGELFCWGRNSFGQLGSGTPSDGPVEPTRVGRSSRWTQVSTGGATTCGIQSNRSLRCWGLDHRGQVGTGGGAPAPRPELVPGGGKQGWKQVATAWFHTCAVRTDGRLACWGDNAHGQLGSGDTQGRTRPHRVPGRTWSSVAVGGSSTCATRTDGSLWCWGRNTFGQLGTGDLTDRATPTRVGGAARWSAVSLSWTHTCGVTRGDSARCWGRNDRGQVGKGAELYATRPWPVPGEHRVTSLATAEGSSCLVDDGSRVWCWGDNRFGQVAPGQPLGEGVAVPRRRAGTASTLSGGWYHFCAVTTRGSSVCWGDNQRGQLGAGPAAAPVPSPPDPVEPGTGALQFRLATFNVLGNHHTRPGADSDRFGPSRVRADWSAQALLNNGVDVAGLQEPDSGQVASILDGADGRLAAFPAPGSTGPVRGTTIVWDAQQFELLETGSVRSQFISRTLRRPLVRLRQVATGREFWVLDVHNPPNDNQVKRNQAVKAQLDKVRKLEATGLPVFYVGDFNEKAPVFCTVLSTTGLTSAAGGRIKRDGTCAPPAGLRIDQLFGSAATQWQGYVVGFPPLVRMSTDHPMVMADVTVP